MRFGADVQIGGGVRVGDAFQVIGGVKSIAIWVTEFCVEISRVETCVSLSFKQEK